MKKFVQGNTYYSHANPSEELDRNFKLMKSYGVNTVRVAEIWPGWSVIEYEPGKYDFSILDDYVEKAVANGLDVCMGIGINDTPGWLYNTYKDLRFVNHTGKVSNRRVQSANFNHKAYRQHMKDYIIAITKHYHGKKGISSWQFGNEIRYNVSICDSEPTRKRFRSWLKEIFNNSLSDLNKEWGTYYRDWNEVYPYKSKDGMPTEGNAPHCIRTQEFQRWSIGELIQWGITIMREYTDLPIFHNNFGLPHQDHWLLAEPCDIVVIDIYATTYDNPNYYNGLLLDAARSIANQQEKPLWIGETSAGQYGTYNRQDVAQSLVENCVMDQIGAGAEGVFYFRHKAPVWEQPHKYTGSQTIYRIDETPTEYVKTPEHVTAFMSHHEELVMNTKPYRPEVAVYYPIENVNFAGEAGYSDIARESVAGARAMWASCQIPVELISSKALLELDLTHFKIIHVPVSYLMSEEIGQCLQNYVRRGGTLLCEGRLAYVDGTGLLYKKQPGAGFHDLIGATEDKFYNTDTVKVNMQMEDNKWEMTLPTLRQSLIVGDGVPIAWDEEGKVLGTYKANGKGECYYLGLAPSLHFCIGPGKYESSNMKGMTGKALSDERKQVCEFIHYFAKKNKIKRPVSFKGGHWNLSVRYLKGQNYSLAFFMNYNEADSINIQLDDDYNVTELTTNGEKEITEINQEIPPLSWRVFKVKKNRKDYFIGMDSDGTVFNTMEIKHKRVFIPLAIKQWNLTHIEAIFNKVAESINLYSSLRGINRFTGLIKTFDALNKIQNAQEEDFNLPDYSDLETYILEGNTLSSHSIREYNMTKKSTFLESVVQWSEAGDALLDEITSMEGNPSYSGIKELLQGLPEEVKTMVVSSATGDSLSKDWGEAGLTPYIDAVAGQEKGSKSMQIQSGLPKGIQGNRALMIGDALGDLEAAKANDILFYPIIPGREEESWKRFIHVAYKRFLEGTFEGEYEDGLIKMFKDHLKPFII